MTLQDLIQRFRIEADDRETGYLWGDEALTDWFNEAQDEAALRARLLLDDYTVALTRIAVAAGVDSYPLHPKLYEIAHIALHPATGERSRALVLTSREKLDRIAPDWRNLPTDMPRWAIQTDTRIRLVPVPAQDAELVLEAYRLPLTPMAKDQDVPEIHEAHHIHLLQWVLHRAFSVPNAELVDPKRAANALAAFEEYFGLRPDADLRRTTRQDEAQVVVSHFP